MGTRYNPITGELNVFDGAKSYSSGSGVVTAFPGDTFMVEHPTVTNMGFIPLVYEWVASIGRSLVSFSMDWPEEYEQEVAGDVVIAGGKMTLKNNAPPATRYRVDVRDLDTLNMVKTGTDPSVGWVYVDDADNAIGSYDTATGLKTTGIIDEISFTIPELFDVEWNYFLGLGIKSGELSIFVNSNLFKTLYPSYRLYKQTVTTKIADANFADYFIIVGINVTSHIIKIGGIYYKIVCGSTLISIDFTSGYNISVYSSSNMITWSLLYSDKLQNGSHMTIVKLGVYYYITIAGGSGAGYIFYSTSSSLSTRSSLGIVGVKGVIQAGNYVFSIPISISSSIYAITGTNYYQMPSSANIIDVKNVFFINNIYFFVGYNNGYKLYKTTNPTSIAISPITHGMSDISGSGVVGVFAYMRGVNTFTKITYDGLTWYDTNVINLEPRFLLNSIYYGIGRSDDCIYISVNGDSVIWIKCKLDVVLSTNIQLYLDNSNNIILKDDSNAYILQPPELIHSNTDERINIKAGDVIKLKATKTTTIKDIQIINEDQVDILPTGNTGIYIEQNPNYVTPRYFITDTWDVLSHKAISITGATLDATLPTNTSLKGLISFNDGVTWNTFSNDVYSEVPSDTIRNMLDAHSIDLSTLVSGLQSLEITNQKIKFAIDCRTTDTTVSPAINAITFSFMQEGMYQQVPTGRGMEWEVYNLTDTQTVFKKNVDNGGKQTILQVVPLG